MSTNIAVSPGALKELRRRCEHPRVILWVGSYFRPDEDLKRILPRLPLAAAYLDSQNQDLESLLATVDTPDGQGAVAITTQEAVRAHDWRHVPLFYLRGKAGENLRGLRASALRSAMLQVFLDSLVEQRPILVAVGVDAEPGEVLSIAADVDASMPVFVLGPVEAIAAEIEKAAAPVTRPSAILQGWTQLLDWFGKQDLRLLLEPEEAAVLVGSKRVSLKDVFADADLRIEDEVRIITTRALTSRPQPDINDLFRAFLNLDERRDAPSALEDVKEWWAIDQGIPLERPMVDQVTSTIRKELEDATRGEARERICWLPAEPGAGSTAVVHQVAHRIAKAGFPTLVLRQLARSLSADRVTNFLAELNRRAGNREMPALLVLDSSHAGEKAVEQLPAELARQRRQVVTLWAIHTSTSAADNRARPWRWEYIDLLHRLPRQGDVFLAALTAGISDDEVRRLGVHVDDLVRRGVRGIVQRDVGTFAAFQRQHDFGGLSALTPAMDASDRSEIASWLRAEQLCWPALYHFLRGSYHVDLDEILARLGSNGISLLLEIAKLSNWGIAVPHRALADWIRVRDTQQARPSPGTAPKDNDVRTAARKLQDHFKGTLWSDHEPHDPQRRALELRDTLAERGLVRSIVVAGHSWCRMAHRAEARQLLLQAVAKASTLSKAGLQPPGPLASILDRDHAFALFRGLIEALSLSPQNIRLCEMLSEALLQGEDSWDGWNAGRGEERLRVYAALPRSLRDSSRALLHHHANVLRRTTFNEQLTADERVRRLEQAAKMLRDALGLPWQTGARDEHPGHMMTTLGLVEKRLARLVSGDARAQHHSEARRLLEESLLLVPDSPHARQALADILLEDATAMAQSADERRRTASVALAAQVLTLLALDAPTAERYEKRWYDTKRLASELFGDAAGRDFLRSLQVNGIEQGFLLEAELLCLCGDLDQAIDLLAPLVDGDRAARSPKSAHRLAALYRDHPSHSLRHAERYRLLTVVEASQPTTTRLTAQEEFELAVLEYQVGHFPEGGRRFGVLRDTGRAMSVSTSDKLFLVDSHGAPERLRGEVVRLEGFRGWMNVYRPGSHARLFSAPFILRHFGAEQPPKGSQKDVLIHFTAKGPKAVPVRFQAAE